MSRDLARLGLQGMRERDSRYGWQNYSGLVRTGQGDELDDLCREQGTILVGDRHNLLSCYSLLYLSKDRFLIRELIDLY